MAGFPKSYGHFFSTQSFSFFNPGLNLSADGEFPVLGRINVAENNSAIPDDRVFFLYNHFNNALRTSVVDAAGATIGRTMDVDRYTVGFEKTFLCGRSSLELRMPMFGMSDSVFNPGFSTTGMSLGNLALISKLLVYESDRSAFAVGSSASVPTGDDVTFMLDQEVFRYRNEAIHLGPYLAFLSAPSRCFFLQGFLEVDVPIDGNPIQVREVPPNIGRADLGRLNEQTVLYADLSLGYWWYRNPCSRWITAVSSAFEVHYATTLQDTDVVSGTSLNSDYSFCNCRNRFDVVNTTVGVDVELQNDLDLRVAGVFPLTDGDDRFFDSELRASINRRF